MGESYNLLFRTLHQYLSTPLSIEASKISRYVFLVVALLSLFWFVYFCFAAIHIPYPIEYREGASQVMTQILLTGGNPFSLERHPLSMNNYGIGYNLIVFPFAKIFGNTLIVHRSVSVFFLFASLFLIACLVWRLKQDLLISIICGTFITIGLAGRGGLGAFSSALGTFLFLSAILLPSLYSFRFSSLALSAVLAILAYYTKPYFVIAFAIVAVYTFTFVSKRKGFFYCLFFLFTFGLLFLGARYFLKLYFIDTFISNLFNTKQSLEHLYDQLLKLGIEFSPAILVGLVLLLFNLSSFPLTKLRKSIVSRAGILQADTPLLNIRINYFAYAFIFCFLVFVLVLGPHKGSYMTYSYQIVVPPFILWLFQMLNSKSRISTIAIGVLLINVVFLEWILIHPSFLHQRTSVAWRNLYDIINTSKYVANNPVLASAVIEAGMVPIDSGQTEYYYNIQRYPDNILLGPNYKTIKQQGMTYTLSIRNAVRNYEFDRIFLTEGFRNLLPRGIVNQYYNQIDTITIEMPQTHQTWVISVWEPKAR